MVILLRYGPNSQPSRDADPDSTLHFDPMLKSEFVVTRASCYTFHPKPSLICFCSISGVKIAVTEAEAQSMNESTMTDSQQLERSVLHNDFHSSKQRVSNEKREISAALAV